jgi:hypothetical protein
MPLMRAPQSADGSGPTRAVVLLVDPQPAERRVLADRLARQQCWAIAPVDLAEADEILKAIRPTLVLIRDGSAGARMLANRVRAEPRCASVLVLMLPGVSLAAAEAQLWSALDGGVPEARWRRAGVSRSG